MRDFNEWELRRLQLELQQLDEDFTELNNYFSSEAFDLSEDFSDEYPADLVLENSSGTDFSDQSIGLFTSIDAADERNDVQMLIEEKLNIY